MIFNAFQREDADNVHTVGKNVSGSAKAVGDVVVLDSGATADGVRVTEAAAATLGLFRGIVAEVIADSGFGKILVHGYTADAKVNGAATAGDTLIAVDGEVYFETNGASDGVGGLAYALATTAGLPALSKVFVRGL